MRNINKFSADNLEYYLLLLVRFLRTELPTSAQFFALKLILGLVILVLYITAVNILLVPLF